MVDTDANGRYAVKLRSIRPRNVKVRFSDCLPPLDFAPIWNGNHGLESHAPWIRVEVGDVHQADAALDRWGGISGLVTDEATSAPLADVCVRAFRRVRIQGVAPRWGGLGSHRRRWRVPDGHPQALVGNVQGAVLRLHPCPRLRHGVLRQPIEPVVPDVRQGVSRSDHVGDRSRARSRRRWRRWRRRRRRRRRSSATSAREDRVVRPDRRSRRDPGSRSLVRVSPERPASRSTTWRAVPSRWTPIRRSRPSLPAGASAGVISVSTAGGTTKSVGTFAVVHDRVARPETRPIPVRLGHDPRERWVRDVSPRSVGRHPTVFHPVAGIEWRKASRMLAGAYRIRVHDVVGRYRAPTEVG